MTIRISPHAWRTAAVAVAFAVAGAAAATVGDAAKGSTEQGRQSQPPQTTAPAPAPAPRTYQAQAAGADGGVYRIGPEDILEISVWKNADLTRPVVVRPDGRISLPLLNDVQAANLTPMQLRDTLAKGLAAYISDPEVSVIVKEIHSVRVSVVGMVQKPNRYELHSQTTVLEALAMAGGFSDFAKRDRIVIYRRDGNSWKTIDFSYGRLINDADVNQNFVIMPGDIVVVP